MKIIDFLNQLDEKNLFYTITKSRDFGIAVMVYIPGERWEVDFLYENDNEECSGVWVERFKSDGQLFDESELEVLFRDFAD
jgi:hypothetical protein